MRTGALHLSDIVAFCDEFFIFIFIFIFKFRTDWYKLRHIPGRSGTCDNLRPRASSITRTMAAD